MKNQRIIITVLILFVLINQNSLSLARIPEEMLVTFTGISNSGTKSDPVINLEWKVYRRSPETKTFEEYNADSLIYELKIVNAESRIDVTKTIEYQNAFSIKEVNFNQKYEFKIRIAGSANIRIVDITDSENEIRDRETDGYYGEGSITLNKSFEFKLLSLFNPLFNLSNKVFSSGKFLGISYILLGITIFSVILTIFFGLKLLCFRRYWLHRIQNNWDKLKKKHIEKIYHELNNLSPKDLTYRPGIRILKTGMLAFCRNRVYPSKDEEYCTLPGINSKKHHWTKIYYTRIALEKGIQREIMRLSNIDLPGFRTEYRNKVWDRFFSIEFFWNFSVIAPMLGLLGTVTGISRAFGKIGADINFSDNFNALISSLSGGINEALYTTMAGLALALPLLAIYYLSSWRIGKIKSAWYRTTDELIQKIESKDTGHET